MLETQGGDKDKRLKERWKVRWVKKLAEHAKKRKLRILEDSYDVEGTITRNDWRGIRR